MEVCVLLSTYNGEKFLVEQLNSIFSQEFGEFEIIARDDASSDHSLKILDSAKKHFSNFQIMESSGTDTPLGPRDSFATLLEFALKNSKAKYFLFCDQDDVWDSTHIKEIVSRLQAYSNRPALVHSDASLIDSQGDFLGPSIKSQLGILDHTRLWPQILVQNVVIGCTCGINKILAEITLPWLKEGIMHDYALAITAASLGTIDYIPKPLTKYRQHAQNASGGAGNLSLFTKTLGILKNPGVFAKNYFDRWSQMQSFEKYLKLARFKDPTLEQKQQHSLELIQCLTLSFRKGALEYLFVSRKVGIQMQGSIRTFFYYFFMFFWRKRILLQFHSQDRET